MAGLFLMPQTEYLVKMNKKAVSPEIMVVLLIFVIGAMILLLFGSALAGQLKEDADIETCRLSVLAQAQTRKIPVVGVSTPGTLVPLDCPRRNLKIFENKVEINGKKTKKYEFKKLTNDEVNRIFAEELRLCWYKTGEGNRNIFENSYLFGAYYTCLICSEIEFDNTLKGKSFEELLEYLKTRKIPKSDITYFYYLIRTQYDQYFLWGNVPWTQYNPWYHGKTGKISSESIQTDQKYSIYFMIYKPSFFAHYTGAYTQAYYIGLGKEEKLQQECDTLVN